MGDMVRWSLRWSNPTTFKEGMQRTKMAVLVPAGTPCPPEILDAWEPGSRYAVSFERVTQRPIRRWSQEAKSRARRRNLKQRMEKKYLLFAAMFEQAELANRPEYYAAADADQGTI